MAKTKHDSKRDSSPVHKAIIPESAAYAGIAIVLIGVATMYFSPRTQAGMAGRMNYVGIAIAVCGCLLWFTSGMDRAQLFEWVRSAGVALCLALVIRWALAEPYRIPSGSMEPTLHGNPNFGRGDRVFVSKWTYGLRYPFMNKRIWYGQEPQRWDLVVFKTVEEDAVHKTLVKRIVGMPGEHLQIRDGKIYADGEALDLPPGMDPETYYTRPLDGPYGVQAADAHANIPEGHYLVLGDNSAYSRDGRYFGWLPNEHIVGRVSCIWWPPQRWRDFTGFSHTWWWRGLLALIALAVVLRLFAGRLCPVPDPSSEDRYDHLLVSFLHYGLHVPVVNASLIRWRDPQRGALVLYHAPASEENASQLLVGHVGGLPGERVMVQNGALIVNDEPMVLPPPAPENYGGNHPDARYGRSKTKEFHLIPEGHYFILSDVTRDGQPPEDSRTVGWIPRNHVVGRAFWCCWPLRRVGRR